MMARDMNWTQALGNAVLAQRPDVMDAVQRMRQSAMNYGYLQNNSYYRVVGCRCNRDSAGGSGLPVRAGLQPSGGVCAAGPGFFVGGAITFGPRIALGVSFAPFGWGSVAFGWRTHDILIDHHPWVRTWANRGGYVHPYATPWRRPAGPRVERHEIHEHERERR